MKRVAALYLPQWPIERLRRAEPKTAPPEAARPPASRFAGRPTPGEGHWRPGARWARREQSSGAAQPHATALPQAAPLVTSIRSGSQNLVAAACPHALALGLRPGMALSLARAQTPGLDIRDATPEADLADLTRMATAFARRWSPIVALDGEDGLFLEITGVAHLFGGEAGMARRLVALLARLGVTARCAVADTHGAAHALARFGSGGPVQLCPPGRHADALAPLPIRALRIEQGAIELLSRLGVDRIGQLAPMPRGPLVRRFGGRIVQRLDQALGQLPEPLDPVIPEQPIAVVRRFAEPILTADVVEHWLAKLVPELAEALAETGQGALRVELIADRIDGVPQRIRLGLARPNRDPEHLLRLFTRKIEQVEPGFGIDAIALHVRRAGPLGPESVTERLDEEAAPDLAPLVDTLATRIGLPRLWRMRPVESDVPERAATRAPVLDPPQARGARRKIDDVAQLDRNPALQPWHPDWPRPVRLLTRPERLDHVIAELPDQAPRRFTWRGRPHKVVRADGPERIHGEWWKRDAERTSVRDYFRVEDEQGHRYWLFRRGDGERAATGDLSWYLHGVFG